MAAEETHLSGTLGGGRACFWNYDFADFAETAGYGFALTLARAERFELRGTAAPDAGASEAAVPKKPGPLREEDCRSLGAMWQYPAASAKSASS
jgi:hypothetical protein